MSISNTPTEDTERATIHDNEIYAMDCRDGLTQMDSESVQLSVFSPPYNIDKDYGAGYDDDGHIAQWKLLMEDVFEQLFRVTKPDGKVVVNIGKSFSNSEDDGRFRFFPLAAYVKQIALDSGFDMWDEAIWNKRGFASRGGGALMGSYPYPSNLMITQTHEHVVVFRKWVSESYHSQREIPPLETDKREDSALTKERWRELTQSVWEFEGVRQTDFDLDHGAVYPEELPKRAIQLYSFKDDTVLDPFMGAGTTAVAAKRAGRNYIGFEQNEEYTEYAQSRVEEAEWDVSTEDRE